MGGARSWVLIAVVGLSLGVPLAPAGGKSPEADAMDAIVESTTLTKEQKLGQIQEFFARTPCWWSGVLWRLEKVDPVETRRIALALFRVPDASRLQRYEVARYMLGRRLGCSDEQQAAFRLEYRTFLIDAVLHGGQEEFCVPRTRTHSAVGEYAAIAGPINSPPGVTFEDIADPRVIPVLIACLSAPDYVYGEQRGDVVRGMPGESTYRNTERQCIPCALAELHAVDAVPVLTEILFTHHDYYLRESAAYALGALLPPDGQQELEARLRRGTIEDSPPPAGWSRPTRCFLFPYGKGLIRQGVDRGVEYMSLVYAQQPTERPPVPSSLMALRERLDVVENLVSPRLEAFYDELLGQPPIRDLFLFNDKGVGADRVEEAMTPRQALDRWQPEIVKVYTRILAGIRRNRLHSLDRRVAEIAEQSNSREMRQLSQEFLAAGHQ